MSGPAPQLPTGLFLGGRFVAGSGSIEVRNPYSGELIADVATGGAAEVARAVRDAAEHLPPAPPAERAGVLERAAGIVAGRSEHFAQVLCREAGKPIRQARAEVARCVDTLTFSAAEARTLAGETVPFDASSAGIGKIGFVRYAPIGILGAIAPFNFPLNLVAHKLGPAIAAGCPVVLKPAEKTPLSALLLAEALAEAGLPPGALAVVTGTGEEVGGALVDHPDVAMISFTGSGRSAGASGSAHRASTSRWSSATRRRSSSPRMPIWSTRRPGSPRRGSRTPASRASACSACTCTSRCTTCSSRTWCPPWTTWWSATRPRIPPTSAR